MDKQLLESDRSGMDWVVICGRENNREIVFRGYCRTNAERVTGWLRVLYQRVEGKWVLVSW